MARFATVTGRTLDLRMRALQSVLRLFGVVENGFLHPGDGTLMTLTALLFCPLAWKVMNIILLVAGNAGRFQSGIPGLAGPDDVPPSFTALGGVAVDAIDIGVLTFKHKARLLMVKVRFHKM